MWSTRKSLRDKDYTNSVTYKKYLKYVGVLLKERVWMGHEKDSNGQPVRDEKGNRVSLWEDRLYLITAVVPQKYYRNRYAFNLTACGEHGNRQDGAADTIKRIKNGHCQVMN